MAALTATAAAVVAAAAAAVIHGHAAAVVAAAAEQDQQNDDPQTVVAAKAVVIHKITSGFEISEQLHRSSHVIPPPDFGYSRAGPGATSFWQAGGRMGPTADHHVIPRERSDRGNLLRKSIDSAYVYCTSYQEIPRR